MKDKEQTDNLKTKCKVCDCTFENEDELQQHFSTRSHIKRSSRHNSIYMSGIPNAPNVFDDLLKFLSQVGGIARYKILGNNNKILVEFQERDAVEFILSKGININNTNLRIDQAKMTYEDDCAQSISYEAMKNIFRDAPFNEQLSNFIEKILLTETDINNIYKPVCNELEELFKPLFPKCKVLKFGSSVTGLGFKMCDLDVYLDTGMPVIKALGESVTGPHKLSSDTLFAIIEKTIRENYKKFSRCIPIPTARVPIVRCIYNPTNVSCDISFKSKLGIYNSRLLKFYFSIDPRFKPLMIILKYWYYNCELRSHIGITKYALTVLYIFYLQQLKLAPSINTLKEECRAPLFINSWQVNFNESLNGFEIDESHKNKSIPELLLMFFEFYMSYDFQNNVICPCDGQSYNKDIFYDVELLPDSMKLYKEYLNNTNDPKIFNLCRPMCVQDPTELNWNITTGVAVHSVEKFQLFCFISANITMNCSNNNYANLLNDLFGFPNKSAINHEPILEKTKEFSIHLYDIYGVVTESKDLCLKTNWIDSTFNLIQQYLEKVLNLQIKVDNNNSNILVLICQGSHCLWKGRKFIKLTDKKADPLQNEIDISRYLLSQMNSKSDSECMIDFECRFEEKKEPKTHISVTVSNNGGVEKMFLEVCNDLMYRMPSVLRKCTKYALTNKSPAR